MSELALLTTTATSIAFVHTVLGPDHYVPFVAMSRARRWSISQTLRVTAACGLGHVAGSVLVGTIGLSLGILVVQLERFESARGDTAAALLIGFGLAYLVWGLVQSARNSPHTHTHVHADGTVHCHEHVHQAEHFHVHENAPPSSTPSLTAWILFVVFVLGPCEPLIPLLIVPGMQLSIAATCLIVGAYAVTTLVTMTACVFALHVTTGKLPALSTYGQQFSHAFAGFAILSCGVLIRCGL